MRTIFIGDIHGCFDEFKYLLKKIEYNKEKDKLYLTGDLINKGPKCFELIDYLVEKKQKEIMSVMGNNEIDFLRFLKGDEKNKNNPLFNSLKKEFKNKHIKYIKNLPTYIENKDWILLHAGVVPGKKLNEHDIDEITRIRTINGKNWYEYYNGNKPIIYGHYAVDGLRIRKNTIGLDSGCVYGKRLTAYVFETGEIFQVPANKQYVKKK